ncbi:MAG: hypothetical protein AB7O52_06875 [Planctomycetota bacterium]
MSTESSDDSSPATAHRHQTLVRRIVVTGWACVLLSAVFLYLSKAVDSNTHSGDLLWSIFMMAARMCGIASFAIGGVAIYNDRWIDGVSMMLFSVVLPVIAFVVYGTI